MLQEAAEELAKAAVTVAERLEMKENGISIFPTGGLFQSNTIIKDALRQSIAWRAPEVQVKEPAFPPIVGGLLLALQSATGSLNPAIIDKLQATFPQAAASKHQKRKHQS